MCRITGLLTKNIDEQTLLKMRDVLSHGGPDDAGLYIDDEKKVGIAQRRLSIIDLSEGGHQPMVWNDYIIVFNGEIYNYKDIRSELVENGYSFETESDTEVILKAFEFWQYDCVQKFRGMFAFAIWDKKSKSLVLCRDRVGVKPLYWYLKDGLFMFASELKAFHENPNFDKSINKNSISLYLQTGYIRSPLSIFQYAHKLEPGSFLVINSDFSIKKWKYWDVRSVYLDTKISSKKEAELIKDCETVLTESFNLRMVADVPVGVFLSGGIDSSIVTALLQRDYENPINTFTIGFEDKKYNEAEYAKSIAKHLGTYHTELYCREKNFEDIIQLLPDFYDEPFGDSSAIPTFLVSELARKKVTVALSADAGDEIFTGYTRYLFTDKYYRSIQKIPISIRSVLSDLLNKLSISQIRSISNFFDSSFIHNLDSRLPKLIEVLKTENEIDFLYSATTNLTSKELASFTEIVEPIFDKKIDIYDKRLYSAYGVVDIESYLEGDILTKVDRASMRVALEGREPFLDHKIIEFALALPDNIKIRNGKTKWILREILYKYVPESLIDRPKMGFGIPLDRWLSTLLKHELIELTNDRTFCDIFGLNYINVKNSINDYIKGKYNKPNVIWYILILYKWYNRWLR